MTYRCLSMVALLLMAANGARAEDAAALGWLFHPLSLLELGPMLRFDLLLAPRGNTPADMAVTLGFELGVAS